MRNRSSINALFLIVTISLLLGFVALSGDKSIDESTTYGAEGALKLRELNIILHREPR